MCVCVYVPHNDQLGRTDFPHNALSPQCIVGTYRCVCVCVCVCAFVNSTLCGKSYVGDGHCGECLHCGENPCVLVGRCGERTHTHTQSNTHSTQT